ncbi:MAG TPA: hypothetical protein VK041_01970 [Opitutales bacterium]|nr:hypothetical protein [Opitutales bacterium]
MKNVVLLLTLALLGLIPSNNHAIADQPKTPFERILAQRDALTINVTDADANELIPRILARTGLQYTFIQSQEERLLSLKVKADPLLALETVVFAAGFNIHKDGSYWVIHPLPIDDNIIE